MDLRIDVRGGGSGDGAFSMLTERWLQGPEKRRAFLEAMRDQIEGQAPELGEEAVRRAVGPALSVLRQGMDGIGLTSTGAYKLGFVKQMAREHPEWARGADPDRLHREADLPMLRDLRAIVEDCSFTYVKRSVAFTTGNGAEMMEKSPTGVLMALGCEIVWDHGFPSLAGELCAAAVLAGEVLDAGSLTDRIHPVLAEFCRSDGGPLDRDATRLAVTLWLDLTASVGVIPDAYLEDLRSSESDAWPRPAGQLARACMVAMLRFRVLRSTVLH